MTRPFRIKGERLRQVDSDLYDRIINHISSIRSNAFEIYFIRIDETGCTLVSCDIGFFGCGRFFTRELIAVSQSIVRDDKLSQIGI